MAIDEFFQIFLDFCVLIRWREKMTNVFNYLLLFLLFNALNLKAMDDPEIPLLDFKVEPSERATIEGDLKQFFELVNRRQATFGTVSLSGVEGLVNCIAREYFKQKHWKDLRSFLMFIVNIESTDMNVKNADAIIDSILQARSKAISKNEQDIQILDILKRTENKGDDSVKAYIELIGHAFMTIKKNETIFLNLKVKPIERDTLESELRKYYKLINGQHASLGSASFSDVQGIVYCIAREYFKQKQQKGLSGFLIFVVNKKSTDIIIKNPDAVINAIHQARAADIREHKLDKQILDIVERTKSKSDDSVDAYFELIKYTLMTVKKNEIIIKVCSIQ